MIFKILLSRSVQTPNRDKNWQTSCTLQTFLCNINWSRHFEFIIEQGHRVNWVSESLNSRVAGSQNATQFHVCSEGGPSVGLNDASDVWTFENVEPSTFLIVVWPTMSCFADRSRRCHVTFVIIECLTCRLWRFNVQKFWSFVRHSNMITLGWKCRARAAARATF